MNRAVLTLLIALSPLAALAQSPAAPTAAPEARAASPVPEPDARTDAAPPAVAGSDASPEAVAEAEARAAARADAQARVEVEAAADAEDLADAEANHDRHCLRDTGTRIKRRDRRGCTPGIGESYTGEELRQTGANTTAEALRLLSPRVGG